MPNSNLSVGMFGDEVTDLHGKLIKHGFDIPAAEVDRKFFGPATRMAVQQCQAEHGLKVTGGVDEATATALDKALAERRLTEREVIPPVAQPATPATPSSSSPAMETGYRGDAISPYTPASQPMAASSAPWRSLAAKQPDDRSGSTISVQPGRTLSMGMQGEDVRRLQDALRQLGFKISGAETEKQFFGPVTREGVLDFQHAHGLETTGEVDERTAVMINAEVAKLQPTPCLEPKPEPARPPGPFIVQGQVRRADGSVLASAPVLAVDKDLRHEEPLGDALTDNCGRYKIIYTADQIRRAEKGSADLIVRVLNRDGTVLIASPIVFNASPVATVDLTVGGEYQGPSEYDQLLNEITPLLEDLPLAEVTEDDEHHDITFLAGETGEDPQHIAFLILAHRLARQTELPPEAFYGLFREKLPVTLPTLLAQGRDQWQEALQAALRDNIISLRLRAQIDAILERLQALIVDHAFKPLPGTTNLSALLSTVLPRESLQRTFLTRFVQHQGSVEEAWQTLKDDPAFGAHTVAELQFALQAAAITRNHLPLVKRLQLLRQDGALSSLRDLAMFDAVDWRELIGGEVGVPTDVPGKDDAEKVENYARTLARDLALAFPTAAIAGRIAKDDTPGKADLVTFFNNNPDFAFDKQPVASYLAARGADALEGVADVMQLTANLVSRQRVFRITPHYDEQQPLLAGGQDSALSITRLGPSAFLAQYSESLGADRAAGIYAQADHISALALAVFSNYSAALNAVPVRVIPDPVPELPPAVAQTKGAAGGQPVALATVPNLTTLFGPQEFCACEECRSIYSPAAYLVDILSFVDGAKALGTLFARRPDLGDIELSCENTNTPLPYIDLVNEMLERAVAQDATPPPPNAPAFQTTLTAEELSANPEHIADAAYIVLGHTVYGWDLPFDLGAEQARVYLEHLGVRRDQLMETFQPLRPGATTGPTEVAIAAEYLRLTPPELRIITGGLELKAPVRVATTAVLTALAGLQSIDGVTLVANDRVLVKDQVDARQNGIYMAENGAWARAADGDVQTGVVVTVNAGTTNQGANVRFPPPPWQFWGLSENDNAIAVPDPADTRKTITVKIWIDALAHVQILRKQSGLTYQELLDLLETTFINPADAQQRRLAVVFLADPQGNATCNLAAAIIHTPVGAVTQLPSAGTQALSAGTAARIHRFVRLQRKLGWTARELDKAITALHAGDLTDRFIVQLAHLKRLRAELRLPLVELLSWFAPIDTAAGDAESPSLYERLFQNKAVLGLEKSDPFALNGQRDELTNTDPTKGQTISAHIPSIIAALGIGAVDLSLLIQAQVAQDVLNLANLSQLYRSASLAKALKLSIRELLSLLALSGINPFDAKRIEETRRFVDLAGKVRTSGFSIPELDYLLRDIVQDADGVAPTQASLVVILNEIQTGLRKIIADTAVESDPTGDLTRKTLALLNWDSAALDEVIATLNGSTRYETTLTALPPGMVFPKNAPKQVKDKVAFDTTTGTLSFVGPMTSTQQNDLLGLATPADSNYRTAVNTLFNAPRTFITVEMRAVEIPPFFTAALEALPTSAIFSDGLEGRISYNAADRELRFAGAMTQGEQTRLLALAQNDQPYQDAIHALFQAPTTFVPDPKNTFLKGTDASLLFDSSTTAPAQRFDYVLAKIMAYLRQSSSERFVKQKLGEALKLDVALVDLLVTQAITSSRAGPQPHMALAEFLDAGFIDGSVALDVQTETLRKLQKAALVVKKLKLTADELGMTVDTLLREPIPPLQPAPPTDLAAALSSLGFTPHADARPWFILRGSDLQWLNLDALPLAPSASARQLFDGWEQLLDFVTLRNRLPSGRPSLFAILETALQVKNATNPAAAQALYLDLLSSRTAWDRADLESLAGANAMLGFVFPADYADTRAPVRLAACFKLLKQLGVAARQIEPWIKPELDLGAQLREARNIRQAVEARYDDEAWLAVAQPLQDVLREQQRTALVGYMTSQKPEFPDTNALFDHFLLDVEMSACQMTSRIKQAISSVQLFVQRALMNLEQENGVSLGADDAKHWTTWMKNYRVWEANRKVFLYPENWIEPELRDDKTPFFKELENELLQGDITNESAEDAFLHYLEKLDAVARLEIAGMYHQQDDDTRVDILHVFGRTWSTPHIYYYRRLEDGWRWTAWEKVDLDIQGDHLIPVVWNRRLHLFWPIFTEKADEEGQPPKKYLEIQIAWSEYRRGKWSAKKMSSERESLRAKQDPSQLFTSPVGKDPILDRGLYIFKAAVQVEPSSETLVIRCIHEGSIRDTSKLDALGLIAIAIDPDLVKGLPLISGLLVGEFQFVGCGGTVLVQPFVFRQDALLVPNRSAINYMTFEEQANSADPGDSLYLIQIDTSSIKVLQQTPGTFRLVYPHQPNRSKTQDSLFYEQDVLFYEDETRTFFVQLAGGGVRAIEPLGRDLRQVSLSLIDRVREDPYELVTLGHNLRNRVIVQPEMRFDHIGATKDGLRRAALGTARVGDDATLTAAIVAGQAQTLLLGDGLKASHGSYFGPKLFPSPLFSYWTFETFYHPYVCEFIKRLNHDGVEGLLRWSRQNDPKTTPVQLLEQRDFFQPTYVPQVVEQPYPREDVDFSPTGAYSQYNWELFFHIPLHIADRLSKNQRFAEAQKWFHSIFDPTDGYDEPGLPANSDEQVRIRYWKVKAFREAAGEIPQTIEQLLDHLSADNDLQKQVEGWKDHPFSPHLLARMRTTVYQRTVVMKYIDNLIAWGDQLFRRETIEAINEATLLYILAAEILGPKPQQIPPAVKASNHVTYKQLVAFANQHHLDALSNALLDLESLLPADKGDKQLSDAGTHVVIGSGKTLFFCIPGNDVLLEYWNRVADRLFKIRHCMNIEGVVRQLPLFEPPIDPALLVRAAAAGVDLSTALNDLNTALPHYRFTTMLQKALDLCADIQALGAALLAALEKRDAEALAQLRSGHEAELLKEVEQVKEKQIEEAQATLDGLKQYQHVVTARQKYYLGRPKRIPEEDLHEQLMKSSLDLQAGAAIAEYIGAIVHLIPDFKAAADVGATYGGSNIGSAIQAFGGFLNAQASQLNTSASLSATTGGYQRRQDDWDHQADLATKELAQVDQQIAAAIIRVEIAKQDLANHQKQIQHADEVESFLKSKFTNTELYDWMVRQLSAVYFQSYQLAYDMAKRAERAYRYEQAEEKKTFITFGYWDNLRKGLLAGEQLHHDLRRMEVDYIDQNKREYEITKHISLALLDPIALLTLKETGECFLTLPEALFDADFPGHYLRRIKTVSLSIPCVTGPYTSVNCTLTLLWNSVRQKTSEGPQYTRDSKNTDSRFRDNVGAIQSIVTSSAQNDSGVFELNFRDERYLPFEGAGAISDWRIELPQDTNAFDFNTISDVIVHLRYTARNGGEILKQAARTSIHPAAESRVSTPRKEPPALITAPLPLPHLQLFSARHEFPTEWHRFLNPSERQTLQVELTKEHFPFQFQSPDLTINGLWLFLKLKDGFAYDDTTALAFHSESADSSPQRSFKIDGSPIQNLPFAKLDGAPGKLPKTVLMEVRESELPNPNAAALTTWWQTVTVQGSDHARLKPEAIEDIWMICLCSVA